MNHDGTTIEPPVLAPDAAAQPQAEPWLSHPALWGLLVVNALVFVAMWHAGPMTALLLGHRWSEALTAQFSYDTLVRYGGSDSRLILETGQWWRLLTAAFLHANVVHIAINLWCLWNLGLFAERLLGRFGTLAVYALTGVAGNLASLALDVFLRRDGLVVGASGAIFGIAGVLIVLLSNKGLTQRGVPLRELRTLRTQVVLFAVVNYALGVAPGYMSPGWLRAMHMDPSTAMAVDNSAHLGGLVFGLLLGLGIYPAMLAGRQVYRVRQAIVFGVSAFGLAMLGYAVATFAGK